MTIDVVLLGTGNPLPDRDRAGAATLVRAGGTDAARRRGRAASACGWRPPARAVHARRRAAHPSAQRPHLRSQRRRHHAVGDEPGRRSRCAIFGPPRTSEVVDGMRAMLQPDVEYRLAHHADLTWEPQLDVVEVDARRRVRRGRRARRRGARPITGPVEPTVGYRIEHDGKAVVLAGDTVPCAGLDELCRGADVYVQTVLRDDLVRMVPMQRFVDTIDYHSTVVQAAQTAARGGVGTLVLTHQVPTPAPGTRRRVDRDRARALRRRDRLRRRPDVDQRSRRGEFDGIGLHRAL